MKQHPGGHTGWHHDDYKVQREFERLYGSLHMIKEALVDAGLVQPITLPNSKTGEVKALWALTTKKDNRIIGKPKVVQSLHFKGKNLIPDKRYYEIVWDLRPKTLEKELRTIDDAQETEIRAFVQTDDVFVKVSGTDIETNYLIHKLEAGPGITIKQLYKGYNEKLEISSGRICYKQTLGIGEQNKLIGTIPGNYVINRISIEVENSFDSNYTISIGDSIAQARLWRFQNDVREEQHYEKTLNYIYTEDTDIYISSNTIIDNGLLTVYVYVN